MNTRTNAFERISKRIPESTKAQIKWQLDIAEEIASFRDKNNLPEGLVQQKLGISNNDLREWLSGLHSFNSEEIIKLSSFLNKKLPEKPLL